MFLILVSHQLHNESIAEIKLYPIDTKVFLRKCEVNSSHVKETVSLLCHYLFHRWQ